MAPPTCLFGLPLRPRTFLVSSSTSYPNTQIACLFSTSPSHSIRTKIRDARISRREGAPNPSKNKNRGLSPMRRKGKLPFTSVTRLPLPQPVLEDHKEKLKTDKDHGLWGFFNAKRQRIANPVEEAAYGRPWTLPELRNKSWDDLHTLWWICAKDRNRITTTLQELSRIEIGFGEHDFQQRLKAVKRTQKYIKWTLTERWYAWEEARKLAKEDASVDLNAKKGGAYDSDKEPQGFTEDADTRT